MFLPGALDPACRKPSLTTVPSANSALNSVATRTPMMIRVICTRTTHSFQTLTTLNLGGHEIGAAVVEQLAHALEVNQVRWTFLLRSHPTMTLITDTYEIGSFLELDRCCRCEACGSRIESEPGEMDIPTQQSSNDDDDHRHLQHWILMGTRLMITAWSIWLSH